MCPSRLEVSLGTNKRYAASIDRDAIARINQGVMREGQPESLNDVELELDRLPLTKTPQPEQVRVWVHYGRKAIRIDAELVAWTPRACAVSRDCGAAYP